MNIGTIDFGGTNVKIAIYNDQKRIFFKSLPSKKGSKFHELLIEVETVMYDFIHKNKIILKSIGIAIPGIVNNQKNIVLSTNKKYSASVSFDFESWVLNKFNCTVSLENDARAALIGELNFGVGKNYKDAVLLTLGTGVGTSACINGEVLSGQNYKAGILGGHFTIDKNGPICSCGNTGCLEALTSREHTKKELKKVQNSKQSFNDFKELFENYEIADLETKKVIDQLINYWAIGVINLIHAYDPVIVILSGGIMSSKDIIFHKIKEYVYSNGWRDKNKVKIVVSKSHNESVLLGLLHIAKTKEAVKK